MSPVHNPLREILFLPVERLRSGKGIGEGCCSEAKEA
jgi:hypothetical protein